VTACVVMFNAFYSWISLSRAVRRPQPDKTPAPD